ncbi:hypothetical protein V8B97DRAFT_2108032 [Scleroderma yunnanense]
MIIAYAYKKYKQKKQEKEEKKRAAAAGGSAQPTQDGEPQPRSSSEARQENQHPGSRTAQVAPEMGQARVEQASQSHDYEEQDFLRYLGNPVVASAVNVRIIIPSKPVQRTQGHQLFMHKLTHRHHLLISIHRVQMAVNNHSSRGSSPIPLNALLSVTFHDWQTCGGGKQSAAPYFWAVQLLECLIKDDSERVIYNAQSHHLDEKGKDEGLSEVIRLERRNAPATSINDPMSFTSEDSHYRAFGSDSLGDGSSDHCSGRISERDSSFLSQRIMAGQTHASFIAKNELTDIHASMSQALGNFIQNCRQHQHFRFSVALTIKFQINPHYKILQPTFSIFQNVYGDRGAA